MQPRRARSFQEKRQKMIRNGNEDEKEQVLEDDREEALQSLFSFSSTCR